MNLDVAAVLRVLTHELRTPISVIHGYTRMLADNRLDADAQPRVISQMQQAANRIAAIGRDATEVARWIRDERPPGTQALALHAAIDQAVAGIDLASRLQVDVPDDLQVDAFEPDAVAAAIVTLARAVAREALHKRVVISARRTGAALDLLIGADGAPAVDPLGPDAPTAQPIDLGQGGLGLSLVLALAVLDAHGARTWSPSGRNDAAGIRLPAREASAA